MKELVLSARARADLEEIWLYSFTQWSQDQADSYVVDLLSICDDLARGYRNGRPADDIRRGLFRYLAKSHVIFFQLEAPNDLVIVRILHSSMDASRHI